MLVNGSESKFFICFQLVSYQYLCNETHIIANNLSNSLKPLTMLQPALIAKNIHSHRSIRTFWPCPSLVTIIRTLSHFAIICFAERFCL